VHDGLSHLGTDSADDAVCAYQTGGRQSVEQVLRREGIHGRDTRDVDDGDRCAGFDDTVSQALHNHLRGRAVQHTDQRMREDALEQLDQGCG
jgi:hypothetical protein